MNRRDFSYYYPKWAFGLHSLGPSTLRSRALHSQMISFTGSVDPALSGATFTHDLIHWIRRPCALKRYIHTCSHSLDPSTLRSRALHSHKTSIRRPCALRRYIHTCSHSLDPSTLRSEALHSYMFAFTGSYGPSAFIALHSLNLRTLSDATRSQISYILDHTGLALPGATYA
jgi:hypothetical protein